MKSKLQSTVILLGLIILLSCQLRSYSQNCLNDGTGLIPITDLAGGFYQGYQGGLYFGSNTKSTQHVDNLNYANLNIKPLNTSGVEDNNNGKIVLLAIGASNPKTEFQSFQSITDTFRLINPYLEIVNGCQGGGGIQKIVNPTDSYWKYAESQLSLSGVNANQVQVIWLEQENTQKNNVEFPGAPLELMTEFKSLFNVFLQNYPNLQICYLTARGYAGYVDQASTTGNGLRQPRDYFHGWAMKWLIDNQVSGDATLAFTGPSRKAPVLDWSAYLWADGKNQRNDGFNWICPTDLKTGDGLHWSPTGNNKAGQAIFKRFYLDGDARKWFLNNRATGLHENHITQRLSIYPNPSYNYLQIDTDVIGKFDAYIYNYVGQLMKIELGIGDKSIVYHNLPNGVYNMILKTKNIAIKTQKFSVDK